MLLLVACGGGTNTKGASTGSGTSANPVKQIVPTTLPSATASVVMPSATADLTKTYTGNGFTIKYPKDWKLTASSAEAAFTDPAGSYNLTIGSTPNPNGAKTADQLADGGISGAKANLKNVKTINLPQTTTVDKQTWSQRSISGTSTLNGQSSDIEAVVLADNHPTRSAATKGYVLVYVSAKDTFEQANAKYFQAMLQSFKYTAA
jgi:hypothetical protein